LVHAPKLVPHNRRCALSSMRRGARSPGASLPGVFLLTRSVTSLYLRPRAVTGAVHDPRSPILPGSRASDLANEDSAARLVRTAAVGRVLGNVIEELEAADRVERDVLKEAIIAALGILAPEDSWVEGYQSCLQHCDQIREQSGRLSGAWLVVEVPV